MSQTRIFKFNAGNDGDYEFEYYNPGCYYTPQVEHQNNAQDCVYFRDYQPQWVCQCNPATYIVDTNGIVYYYSDFEYQLQLPSALSVETEITYHYVGTERTTEEQNESPSETDNKKEEETAKSKQSNESGTTSNSDGSEADQEYLVEEPEECESIKRK